MVGQFTQGDLEIGAWAVGAFHAEDLGAGDGGAEEEPLGDRGKGFSLGIALSAAHAGENRMVDAAVITPTADGVVALVALDEAVLGAHGEGLEGERLVRLQFPQCEIGAVQQHAVGAEDQLVGYGGGVDAGAQIEAEILDCGFGFGIDNGSFQCLFGDVVVGLEQQRGEGQRLLVVEEAVLGDGIGREIIGQVVVEQQQLAQGVAVLGDGEASGAAVARGGAQAGLGDAFLHPGGHLGFFSFSGLEGTFGWHGSVGGLVRDVQPEFQLALLEGWIEIVHPDAGSGFVGMVAALAILLEKGADLALKNGIGRFLRLGPMGQG